MDGFETLLAAPMLGTNPAGASNLFGGGDVGGTDQFNLFGGAAAQPPPSDVDTGTSASTTAGVYTPTKPNYLATYDTGAGDLERLLKAIYTPDDTGTKVEKPPGQDALLQQPEPQTNDSTKEFLKHGQDFVNSYGDGHDQAQGYATTFGLDYGAKVNPNGTVDSRYYDAVDDGKGAFGYNTRDPNLKGAALPIPVIQNSIGDYTRDPKLFEAIRRGDYKVLITGADGRREQVPIVDVGSKYLDLTYRTSHDFNTQGKAKLGYQIIGPDGNTLPIKGYHPYDVAPTKFDGHVQPIPNAPPGEGKRVPIPNAPPGEGKLVPADVGLSFIDRPAASDAYSKGRGDSQIQNIILHSSDGREKGDLNTLTSAGGHSAHYYVTRDGRIYNLVPEGDTAYHAGKVSSSEFSNASTLGIEQEHYDPGKESPKGEDWPEAQVTATAKLSAYLLKKYGLSPDNIKTHSQIAVDDQGHLGRKQDPFGYPFDQYDALVKQFYGSPAEGTTAAKPEEKPVEETTEEARKTAEEEPPPEEDLSKKLADILNWEARGLAPLSRNEPLRRRTTYGG